MLCYVDHQNRLMHESKKSFFQFQRSGCFRVFVYLKLYVRVQMEDEAECAGR